ncbi:hypothetical protein [Nocardia goodfellowii]|uniref:Uncharacterized protein n=1 Tax=Nocardia goodfellowii TaxID=882446 RepID=A0ABS4Q9P5_9NOCA|nr:hypothetical protein [Nocardia goodfellowii]MBP2187865.1 hypothetical protein [Nocardia goodfellowii]
MIEEVSQRGIVTFGMRVFVADAPTRRAVRYEQARCASKRGGGAHAPPQAPLILYG